MVWVKVCGLSTLADLEAASEAGADAFGMVLAEGTPRCISVENAEYLAGAAQIPGVLVTVDQTPGDLIGLAEQVGAWGVQPHGRHGAEAAEAAVRHGLRVLRPVKVGSQRVCVDGVPPAQIPILDTADSRRHGGTGRSFDYGRVPQIGRKWVLAGGLAPHNVAEAVNRLQPWGVDASSHLESSLGVKDPARIRSFVKEAKRL
ncbi:MAG: phosphoribosylanthranilate isomerase [bacterium]|nr:phosphoribosylanthranilate isomerase [Acidimicrobiia bacterium]MCY4650636.1 phosphoribosylanthranilate isomerase [bacterium]